MCTHRCQGGIDRGRQRRGKNVRKSNDDAVLCYSCSADIPPESWENSMGKLRRLECMLHSSNNSNSDNSNNNNNQVIAKNSSLIPRGENNLWFLLVPFLIGKTPQTPYRGMGGGSTPSTAIYPAVPPVPFFLCLSVSLPLSLFLYLWLSASVSVSPSLPFSLRFDLFVREGPLSLCLSLPL